MAEPASANGHLVARRSPEELRAAHAARVAALAELDAKLGPLTAEDEAKLSEWRAELERAHQAASTR